MTQDGSLVEPKLQPCLPGLLHHLRVHPSVNPMTHSSCVDPSNSPVHVKGHTPAFCFVAAGSAFRPVAASPSTFLTLFFLPALAALFFLMNPPQLAHVGRHLSSSSKGDSSRIQVMYTVVQIFHIRLYIVYVVDQGDRLCCAPYRPIHIASPPRMLIRSSMHAAIHLVELVLGALRRVVLHGRLLAGGQGRHIVPPKRANLPAHLRLKLRLLIHLSDPPYHLTPQHLDSNVLKRTAALERHIRTLPMRRMGLEPAHPCDDVELAAAAA